MGFFSDLLDLGKGILGGVAKAIPVVGPLVGQVVGKLIGGSPRPTRTAVSAPGVVSGGGRSGQVVVAARPRRAVSAATQARALPPKSFGTCPGPSDRRQAFGRAPPTRSTGRGCGPPFLPEFSNGRALQQRRTRMGRGFRGCR